MDVTALSLRNDRVVLIGVLAIIVLGVTTFATMPRSESPPFVVRHARVVTQMPGASPERIEQLITDKIEKAVREMPEVDFVSSISKTGISVVTVAIKESYKDMRPIWDDLRRKVQDAARTLPASAFASVVETDLGDVYEVTYALIGEGFSNAELYAVAEDVRDEFLLAPEVAKVEIVGEQDERVFIEYDTARLAELGLSPASLQAILSAQNITAPGGQLLTEREIIVIEPSGSFESVDAIRRTTINVPGRTDLVFLEDIAAVRRAYVDPPKALSYLDGERALVISASMRKGGNIIELGADLAERVRHLEETYPIGIEFTRIVDVPRDVQGTIDDFVANLVQAVAVVLLVMLVFLGVRTGLVIVTLVPATMFLTLALMGAFDIGLDQVSLAALIIALGMLVDNAIVMAEAIMVRIQDGEPPRDAAIAAARELRLPLLVSSLTTSAAFLPIFLAESAMGEFTASLFKVVTLALLSSWVLALTMIPLFCVLFLRIQPRDADDETEGRFGRAYRATLSFCLRRRWVPLTTVVLAFVGSLSLMPFLDQQFFPNDGSTYFTVDVELPPDTPIDHTTAVVQRLDAFISAELTAEPTAGEDRQGVLNWGSFVGEKIPAYTLGKSSGPASSDVAMMMVNTTSAAASDDAMTRVRRFAAETFPDALFIVEGATNGPTGGTPIQLRIHGRDLDATFDKVDAVKAKLRAIEGTLNVRDDWGARSKKLLVEIDQAQARRAGVTSQDIATSLRTSFSGFDITEYREGDDAIPVTLRSVAAERFDLDRLATMSVLSQQSGRAVPLAQVADTRLVWQNAKRLRRDGLTAVTVLADLGHGYTAAEINAQIIPWLDAQSADWPRGYGYAVGGESENSTKASQSIVDKLPLAAIIILTLLISQFNSVRRAAIVLMTIPLALIGVMPGLLLSGQPFGFMTLLGVVSLAGIVINNAIVLLDRIRIEIEDFGKDAFTAVIDASRTRVRPILLTTVTTICGLIPLYLGGGAMWETMAMAIMAGLTVSTLLTLLVVPTLYGLMFRVRPAG